MYDIMVIVKFSIKFESKGVTYMINIIDELMCCGIILIVQKLRAENRLLGDVFESIEKGILKVFNI